MKSGFFESLKGFVSSIQFFQNFAIKTFLTILLYSIIFIGRNFVNNGLKEIGIDPINIIDNFLIRKSSCSRASLS